MIELRALSYNIHWGIGMDDRLDLRRVADVIRRIDPDLVGVQEVDRNRRPETGYVDQLSALADRLGWDAAYGVTIEEEPTPESGGAPRQYGIAVLTPHDVVATENHHLTHVEGTEQRTLLETRIDVGDAVVPFYNTHFGLTPGERRDQARDVLELTDGVGEHVLVGDFNATPDSEPVEALTDRYTDVLAVEGLGGAETFPSPYVESDPENEHVHAYREVYVPDRRIDYVFCTPGIEVRGARVVRSLASDHSPVVADLAVPA